MSSGYAACTANIIEVEDLRKVGNCSEILNNLINSLQEYKLDDFAKDIIYDEDNIEEEIKENIADHYYQLQIEFEKQTGLKIVINHHDPDNGDIYDGVEGVYWEVLGCYIPSPALVKLREQGLDIKTVSFVFYG